jgi:hypothetical protein
MPDAPLAHSYDIQAMIRSGKILAFPGRFNENILPTLGKKICWPRNFLANLGRKISRPANFPTNCILGSRSEPRFHNYP